MLASGYLFVEYVFCPGHFLLLKDDICNIGESVIFSIYRDLTSCWDNGRKVCGIQNFDVLST
jgi:hypothetical protein